MIGEAAQRVCRRRLPGPAAVAQGWMDSPGHREHMLTCAFREAGVAVARPAGSTDGAYWTAVFSLGQG